MKRFISKLSIMLLLAFSIVFIPVADIEAADGTMQITDGSAAVGETILVTVTVEAGGAEIGDCEATLSYDSSLLEFVEGTHATLLEEGSVLIAQYGTGTETMFTFELQFNVLAEGDSAITLADATAYLYSDETLYLQATGGAISGSNEPAVIGNPVEIAGTTYTFYDNFTDALVLEGFSKGTLDYDGFEHNVIVQDATGRIAAYFVAEGSDPVLAMYDESSSSFGLTELISITSENYILLLEDGDGSSLSDDYAETTLEMNGTIFPVWQNMDATDYYLVYALSSTGYEGFYQYDSSEGTYQRYTETPEVAVSEEEGFDNIILDKVNDIVNDNFIYFLGGIVIVILVLIIIVMIMSSIIGKRNAEIDDLYDELENGSDEASYIKKESDDEDEYELDDEIEYDYDEESEEEYYLDEDYDYDEEYDEESVYDEDYDDYDEESDYDDDYEDYDYEEEIDYDFEEEEPETKYSLKKRGKVSKDTYDYSVDFIDL